MSETAMSCTRNFEKLPDKCKDLFFECFDPMSEIHGLYYPNLHCLTVMREFDYSECKSPIEKIFFFTWDLVTTRYFYDGIYVYPQYEINVNNKQFFADFMIFSENYKNDVKIIVECDGYDYHSSKEQIKKDNERDIILKTAGYDVVRFTGSQIFNDPIKCVEETMKLVLTKSGKYMGGKKNVRRKKQDKL